jgi:hypothetical protein
MPVAPSRLSVRLTVDSDSPPIYGKPIRDSHCITDPADKAMLQIVAMGFTPSEARNALMKTDNGIHHCVQLAVERLLQNSGLS